MILIPRKPFLDALATAASVAGTKSTMPVLANVLLKPIAGGLEVWASDLETTVVTRVECEGAGAPITLPAKQLHAVVKAVAGDEVKLEIRDANKATLRAGKSKFDLVGMVANDFPTLPDFSKVTWKTIDAAPLRGLIKSVEYAPGLTDSNHRNSTTTAVYITEHKGKTFACGANYAQGVVDCADFKLGMQPLLIPHRAIGQVLRAIEASSHVGLATDGQSLLVDVGAGKLATKLCGEAYPFDMMAGWYEGTYEKAPTRVTCESSDLEAILARVALLVASPDDGVWLKIEKDRLHLSAATTQGVSEDEIPVDYSGPARRFRIDPKLFGQALGHLVGAIDLIANENDRQPMALFSHGTARAFIVPMAQDAPKARDPEMAVD